MKDNPYLRKKIMRDYVFEKKKFSENFYTLLI